MLLASAPGHARTQTRRDEAPCSPPLSIPACCPSSPPLSPPPFWKGIWLCLLLLRAGGRLGPATPAPQRGSPLHPLLFPGRRQDDMAPGVFTRCARLPRPRHRNYNPRHWAKNTAGAASSWARGRTGARRATRGEGSCGSPARRRRGQGRVTASVGSAQGGGRHLLGRGGSG